MKQDIILFGMQGSGKGTQGSLLKEHYGYTVFDTGSALRAIAAEDSELGRKVKSVLESGNLVSTEIVMDVLEDFVVKQDSDTPILFDGIPRNAQQHEQFLNVMERVNRNPTVVYISLPREEAEARLLKRKTCKNCKKIFAAAYADTKCDECGGELITRSDDNIEAITQRIDVFLENTKPIIDSYFEKNKAIEIDGRPSIEEVYETLQAKLELK